MVSERTFLEPQRIARFIVRCTSCQVETALPVAGASTILSKCPHCKAQANVGHVERLNQLVAILRSVASQQQPSPVIEQHPVLELTFEVNGRE